MTDIQCDIDINVDVNCTEMNKCNNFIHEGVSSGCRVPEFDCRP